MHDRFEQPESKLVELLHDLARDPEATLFAMAARAPYRTTEDLGAGLSPRIAGIRPSERELLSTQRERFGELLRKVAIEALFRDEKTACLLNRFDDRHQLVPRCTDRTLRLAAKAILRTSGSLKLRAGDTRLFTQLSGPDPLAGLRASAICRLWLRAAPSDGASILYAHALRTTHEYLPAGRIIMSVVERSRAPRMLGISWSAAGLIHLGLGDLVQATACFRNSLRSYDLGGHASLNLLGTGLRAGDPVACHEAVEYIESEFRDRAIEIKNYCHQIQAQRVIGQFQSKIQDITLLHPKQFQYGPRSAEVVHAFM